MEFAGWLHSDERILRERSRPEKPAFAVSYAEPIHAYLPWVGVMKVCPISGG